MVGIDGGYVRAGERGRTHRDANFEVVVGQSIAEDRDSRYFGLVQSFDDKPKRRLHEVLREQGLQMNQDITFLTDGGDTVRNLAADMSQCAEHVLDWFHLTMRLTVLGQIVDGTLHVSPRPPTLAALAKTRLSAGLGRAFDRGRDGPGGWWIFHEPELHFGEDVLVPDVTGWRRERMPKLPDTDYVSLAPDWACEVLSPATRRLDLVDKRPVYAREGVPHLWLVDPADRTLEAFELHDGQWLRHPGRRCDRSLDNYRTRRAEGIGVHVRSRLDPSWCRRCRCPRTMRR